MTERYRMFAAYNGWANERIYGVAAKLADADYRADRGAFFKSVHGTLNHLLVGDRIWMRRFTGEGEMPDRLDAIRRLAYSGPDEGRGPRGMALAGVWEGSIEDGGPPRSIRLQVRLDGDRLAGAMTSSAGGVAMGIPLHDLSYDRGMVRFSAVLGGAPRQFRGALEGATLAGTIHPAEGAPATGRFNLRHVE